MVGSLFSAGESSAVKSKEKSVGNNPTKTMHDRWIACNQILPALDQKDIAEECPRFN